jgi:hypothetical protein
MHSLHHSALFVSLVLDVARIKVDVGLLCCHDRRWFEFSHFPKDFQALRFN